MNKLNIIDESGEIVGEDTRENIHIKGLLHKEIHVWFYTPDGKIIFQHRSKNKDTFPNLLDATVGGHVEIGMDFEDTAIKEIEEEAGIKASLGDLKFVEEVRIKNFDNVTGKSNNVIRKVFAYQFSGNINDLKTEDGESVGFESWTVGDLENISSAGVNKFIPGLVNKESLELYKKIISY